MNKVITLDEFIIQRQKDFTFASGDLSALLRDIGLAAKIINREVNKAGLVDILGSTGTTNIQGEEVKKLDEFANDTLIESLQCSGRCAGIASEENDDFVQFKNENSSNSQYVVVFDPLDGSSNIDVNVSIGTIFSIYRKLSEGPGCELNDFLQPGDKQVAAGYVIYGSSTMMVYSTGNGVNGFTLDPSIGEFCLSHPDFQTPERGGIYSVNQGYYSRFNQDVRDYIKDCENDTSLTLRYIGSGVADFHRNLIKGGIFMYPALDTHPKGKLRLVYECNPLSYLQEQAGGVATDGFERILGLKPSELHQRTPFFLGSSGMMEDLFKTLNRATNEG